jgi:hypothetical protein
LSVWASHLRLAAERGDVKAIHLFLDGPWVFSRLDLSGPTAPKLAELILLRQVPG